MKSIAAAEAKTQLTSLIEEVKTGAKITITDNGKPVAKLVPVDEDIEGSSIEQLLERAGNLRQSVKESLDIRAMRADGRKY